MLGVRPFWRRLFPSVKTHKPKPAALQLLLERLEDRLTPATPAHFAVVGDFGLAGQPELDVANLIKGWSPDFVVTVGDNNYFDGAASTIDANIGQYYHDYIGNYTGSYGAGSAVNRFWPLLGNHDWLTANAQPYLDYFTLPGNERYYTFTQGPVQFFMLDSDFHEPDGRTATSVQANWLKAQLAASPARWQIVLFHHPPYSSDEGSAMTADMRWPFKAWGADAVFSGHAHDYERLDIDGIPYFVDGLGGESRGNFVPTPVAGSQVRFGTDFGAMLLDVTDTTMNFQFITRAGKVIDSYIVYRYPTVHRPGAPSYLGATPVSATQVNLAWSDGSGNETGFEVQRSTDGTSFTTVATLGAGAQAYTDTVSSMTVLHYYRVRAFNSSGNSPFSAVANDGLPAAPTSLTAALLSSSQVYLKWSDKSANETGFVIDRATDGTTFTRVVTVGANVLNYTDNGLALDVTYTYRVRATNYRGDSANSNVVSATTSASAGPAIPTGLRATAVSTSQVNLAWVDQSTTEDGFRVERGIDSLHFTAVATVAAGVTSYSDTGLSANTRYYYRIIATSAAGNSAPSSTVSATTAVPPAPTSLSASAVSATQVNLSWTVSNTSNTSGFKVERSLDGVNFTQVATVNYRFTTYSDTGRSPNTRYYYRVRAYNTVGNSDYSVIVSVITPAA